MKALRYFFLLFVQALCACAFSQKHSIPFEHINTNLGLSQSNVICIFQDSRGFMWFGTRDGLNKYDGYKFTVYKYDAADTNNLSFNTIHDIVEDSAGNLWIATWGGGLNVFNRAKEKFSHPAGGPSRISSLLFDSDRNLWIGSEGQGLLMYDRKSGKFISHLHNENDQKSLSDDFVRKIVEDDQHNLWIGTTSGGLNLFDKVTKKFTHFTHDEKNKKSLSSDNVGYLFLDHKGLLWIGSATGELDLFNKANGEFQHFSNYPADNRSTQSFYIRSIVEDDKGNLWIGTENGGLFIFNLETHIFENYKKDDADNSSLSDNSVWSLCKDDKGSMWIGTFGAGLDFVNKDVNKFTHYRHNSSTLSLNNNRVLSILEDSKKNIWIGTDGGGINLFDPEKGSFTHYLHQASNTNSIGGNYVLKVFEDSKENLWIGTWGDGVTVFNKEKNTFRHFKYDPANPKGLGGNNVWTIGEDAEKNVWLGFYNSPSGLDMYDSKTNSFIHYIHDESNLSSLSNNIVNSIYTDKKGNLWIATNGGGLDLFNKETKTFTHTNKESENRISDNNVYCVTEDHDGNLWIGTSLGLNKMDRSTGRIKQFFIKDGLPSNTITGILVDEKGNLWISTYNGLSKYDKTTNVFKNFGINDGLQSNEFKMNSCYKSRNGKMYFGGINGFNVFSPDSIKDKSYEPRLVLTDFQIFNKEVPISNDDKEKFPLAKNITDTKELILSYKESVFSFEFASLNYADQTKKQYAYMLEGFDKEWNDIGTRHSATYTNLDPGKYVFKVRGLDNEGNWSSNMATLQLIITPPFWLTWWFRILGITFIIGGAIAFYKFRVSSMKKHQIVLQGKVDEQTRQLILSTKEEKNARRETEELNQELERKNKELEQFAYVASHDMQEPLRTTTSFVELLQNQYKGKLDEKADKYLTFIAQSSERMKALIKDLLEYSRIGRKKELENLDCNNILKDVLADLSTVIDETGTRIDSEKLPVVHGYPTELKQLFQNLITNAIKFRKKTITPIIDISIQETDGFWQFAVKDNGIGIEKEHSIRIFEIFQRLHTRNEYEGSGIGLSNCKKIVEIHNGRIWVESILSEGSTFYFTIRKLTDDGNK